MSSTFRIKCACGVQWSSTSQAHCASCHRHFSSPSGFDAHRDSQHNACVNPNTLVNKTTGNPRFQLVSRANCSVTMWAAIILEGSFNGSTQAVASDVAEPVGAVGAAAGS